MPKLLTGGLGAALLAALALPAAAPAASAPELYVSLGDSYAVGYQRLSETEGRPTRHGFADQVVRRARRKGHRFTLVNFGCGGATTTSILEARGCSRSGRAIGGRRYRSTQAVAAERFLRRHRGEVGLVTISIGGNDVTACAREADPVPCVAAATDSIERNVARLARRVRRAAGRDVRIVGLTYPDVILGAWVREPADEGLARLSVVAFRSLINPALEKAYERAGARFVDVTAATGAYDSLERTTALPPYGTIPVPVARICRLTYFCRYGDIHANTRGYGLIARLVVRTLPRARRPAAGPPARHAPVFTGRG